MSYQPDWFHQVKVTRNLASGRQSTKTLFRNPDPAEADAGSKARTRIQSAQLGVDVEVTVEDPGGAVRRVTVEAVTRAGKAGGEPISFVISRRNPRR